eukprot:scaffold1449_cov108-Isochrysis_galbana.AAC.1
MALGPIADVCAMPAVATHAILPACLFAHPPTFGTARQAPAQPIHSIVIYNRHNALWGRGGGRADRARIRPRAQILKFYGARKVGVGVLGVYPGDRLVLKLCSRHIQRCIVYGRLIGSRVGASSVGLKRAGSADPVEEMAAGALRGLVCAFFVCCWCLAPKNALRPQAPQDDAGRETPERK